MGFCFTRRSGVLLALTAAALATGCPPVNPPVIEPPDQTADRKAIMALVDHQELAVHFQSRLINDGVGIFSATEQVLPALLPRRWGRSYTRSTQGVEERPSDAVSLSLTGLADAEGIFQMPRPGKLVLDYTWQRKLLAKPFVETLSRRARFRKSSGTWQLASVTPTRARPEASGLRVGEFALIVDGQSPRRFKEDDFLSIEDLPKVLPDQKGRIEAQLSYVGAATQPAFYAFLHVPPTTQRLILRDDGLFGDVRANDGVYTAPFSFPSEPGLKHLVIDAVAGKTFADPAMTNYDSTQWGIPYRVQGGEAR
jgi:hypothetical protein